jgi:hypothetical protein
VDKIDNLKIFEIDGRWTASWDRNGRHFDVDYLYGCGHKRSFAQLKGILEEEHGIILPSELAVKSHAIQRGHKNIFVVDEKLLNYHKESKAFSRVKYSNKGISEEI